MDSRDTLALSEEYTKSDHEFRERDPYARAKYMLTMRWLKPFAQPGMRLFNIGCGGGYFNQLAAGFGLEIAACEPERNAFELAKQFAPASCEVYNCGLQEFREKVGGDADFIVMHDVLEHIYDDIDAAERLSTLLRPGGLAVLSVPALQSLFGSHDQELGHYRRYTKRSLRKVLGPYFDIKKLQYFGMLSIPIVLYFSKLRRKPYPATASRNGSIASKAYGAICSAESFVSEPTGTSIIALLALRSSLNSRNARSRASR